MQTNGHRRKYARERKAANYRGKQVEGRVKRVNHNFFFSDNLFRETWEAGLREKVEKLKKQKKEWKKRAQMFERRAQVRDARDHKTSLHGGP